MSLGLQSRVRGLRGYVLCRRCEDQGVGWTDGLRRLWIRFVVMGSTCNESMNGRWGGGMRVNFSIE